MRRWRRSGSLYSLMVCRTILSRRPTRDELLAARDRAVPDIIAPELKVLFCGINPGLYSGAVGHHFARPGNRFWKALFQAGFTDRLLAPSEEHLLPGYGCGITNIVNRATAQAAELSVDELREGAHVLERKARHSGRGPLRCSASTHTGKPSRTPRAVIGRQGKKLGATIVWVLPNPSGINASYQMEEIVRLFSELRALAYAMALYLSLSPIRLKVSEKSSLSRRISTKMSESLRASAITSADSRSPSVETRMPPGAPNVLGKSV